MHLFTEAILGRSAVQQAEADAARARLVADAALSYSARAVTAATAAKFDLSYAEAWREVLMLSRNSLDLFSTPEGWSLVSQHIAIQMLGEPACIMPTIH